MLNFEKPKFYGIAVTRDHIVIGWIVETPKGYETEGLAGLSQAELAQLACELDMLNKKEVV